MQNAKPVNLCEICWKQFGCFKMGIFERQTCDEYNPLSLEEIVKWDEFIRNGMVGNCPRCGSKKTYDCENPLELIDDNTIGYCLDCGVYWCLECNRVLDKMEKETECPHRKICNQYPDYDEFGCLYAGYVPKCPTVKAFLEEKI